MILAEVKQSIEAVKLSHQDRDLLLAFLKQYTETEQRELAAIAMDDDFFWVKLAVRIHLLENALKYGTTDLIMKELADAATVARRIDTIANPV